MPKFDSTPSQGVRAFESLLEFSGKLKQGVTQVPRPELLVAFEELMDGARIVSFDIFDTLLVRHVAHPLDVFCYLESHSAFSQFRKFRPEIYLPELRVRAEDETRRQRFAQCRSGEVLLPEIYTTFCKLAQVPLSEASAFSTAEEEIEIRLVRPNPCILQLYQIAKSSSRPIIAVSDTYHRRAFLVRLLAAVGVTIAESDVFASSELRMNKQSGQLWKHLLGVSGVSAGQILHVGDHPVSDCSMPRSLGIQALQHSHCATVTGSRPSFHSRETATTQSYIRSACTFVSQCDPQPESFWWQYGHNVMGPLLVGFCQWLHQSFLSDGIDRAYFLLRDGEIFARIYSVLFPEASIKPRLLHSSRRAYVFPLLEQVPEFVLQNLFVGVGTRQVGEYLARLGISPVDFPDVFMTVGFTSHEQLVDGRYCTDRLRQLAEHPAVYRELELAAHDEKEQWVSYLRQEELLKPGRIAIVDLGWNGTIHKSLHLLLDQQVERPNALFGYHLATSAQFQNVIRVANLNVRSFLFHFGEPKVIAEKFQVGAMLAELACSSKAGSLLRFRGEDGVAVPVLLPNPHDASQLMWLSEIHEGAIAFAKSFLADQRRLGLVSIPPQVAAEAILRVQTNPTKEEASLLGGFSFCDDFGSSSQQYLSRFRETSCSLAEIWEDYQRAAWKAGMQNQTTVQCTTLRSLLWLLQP